MPNNGQVDYFNDSGCTTAIALCKVSKENNIVDKYFEHTDQQLAHTTDLTTDHLISHMGIF